MGKRLSDMKICPIMTQEMVITRIPFNDVIVPLGVVVFMMAAKFFWMAKHIKNVFNGWAAI